MHPQLRGFLVQWLRVALATLVPVVFTAFLSLPLALGGHPGEERPASATRHMT